MLAKCSNEEVPIEVETRGTFDAYILAHFPGGTGLILRVSTGLNLRVNTGLYLGVGTGHI